GSEVRPMRDVAWLARPAAGVPANDVEAGRRFYVGEERMARRYVGERVAAGGWSGNRLLEAEDDDLDHLAARRVRVRPEGVVGVAGDHPAAVQIGHRRVEVVARQHIAEVDCAGC